MNTLRRRVEFDAAPISSMEHAQSREKKWPVRYDSLELVALFADVATIFVANLIAAFAHVRLIGATPDITQLSAAALPASVLFVALMKSRGMYLPKALLELRNQIRTICLIWFNVLGLMGVTMIALQMKGEIPWNFAVMYGLVGLTSLIVQRILLRDALRKGLAERRFSRRKIVLITHEGGVELIQTLGDLGFFIEKHFTVPLSRSSMRNQKELIDSIIEHAREKEITEIFVGINPDHWSRLRRIVLALKVLPLRVRLVPIGASSELFHRPSRELGSTRCVELQRGPLSTIEQLAKRALDVILSAVVLIASSPLLVLFAIGIKLDSRGPILFKQQRCGFNGRRFTIYKFRTMSVLEDGPTIVQAKAHDLRVTRIGWWLRKSSIDELPQLFNVLQGSMSIVGPRPHALAHDNEFDKVVRNYAFRRRVKPGLTGLAQIRGFRGPTPTVTSIEGRIKYDLHYIDNWSLGLDLMILLQTPIELIRGRNAY